VTTGARDRPAPPAAPPRRRGRPSNGDAQATRLRVTEAARHAFATQGYSGATMRSIAARAGVTAMAVYNYAPSKVALFELVWRDSIEAIYRDYEGVVAGRATLVDEVDAILDRSREVLVDNPDHIRFVVRVLVEQDHADLADIDLDVPRVAGFFRQLADRSVERGEIAERDREHLVVYVTTLLWGITTLAGFDPAVLDRAVDAAKWAARRQLTPATQP
jgi:AcrR family transcriptional regulator